MGNPYSVFGTDKSLEAEKGVKLEYDGFSINIHRAGGGNRNYQRVLANKMRPHRRKVEQGALGEEVSRRLLAEVYAEAVVTGWDGVTDRDGKALEFTAENCVTLLLDLPDLFDDIINSASDVRNFRAVELEIEEKNSAKS
ncbi:MAG: hypothetical protein DI551_05675 [Micavibrio aeruginosavorus]|uniref:Tail assembly chaperone n=1 Tax=Micavibrio aeruginosavorus TaxID=349221 RepID=A0A2W5N0L6_9BACT|nr:MAG: hypothetical protein DI551_05675 [Micavibrio aeruginosavorus]